MHKPTYWCLKDVHLGLMETLAWKKIRPLSVNSSKTCKKCKLPAAYKVQLIPIV